MRNRDFAPCMCGDSECPSCGLAQGTLSARDARSIPPQATDEFWRYCQTCGSDRDVSINVGTSPATSECARCANAKLPPDSPIRFSESPLVSAERRREIEIFVRTIQIVENAFHCKLRGDTDLSGDILIIDQANPLPAGYEFSAYIEPNGHLEFTEWVLDDEIGIESKPQ